MSASRHLYLVSSSEQRPAQLTFGMPDALEPRTQSVDVEPVADVDVAAELERIAERLRARGGLG